MSFFLDDATRTYSAIATNLRLASRRWALIVVRWPGEREHGHQHGIRVGVKDELQILHAARNAYHEPWSHKNEMMDLVFVARNESRVPVDTGPW